jgi:hypothetical protein
MTSPVYETNIPFEEIDRLIAKIYTVVEHEPAPVVIAAMISMVVLAMHPTAPAEVLIKHIEDISQFITLNIMTPPDSDKTTLN